MIFIDSVLSEIRLKLFAKDYPEDRHGDVGGEQHPSHRVATFKREIHLDAGGQGKIIIHFHRKRSIFSATYILLDDTVRLQVSLHGMEVIPRQFFVKIEQNGTTPFEKSAENMQHLSEAVERVKDFLHSDFFKEYRTKGFFYFPDMISESDEVTFC